eukprot:5501228-Prymnesium_polylepis.2
MLPPSPPPPSPPPSCCCTPRPRHTRRSRSRQLCRCRLRRFRRPRRLRRLRRRARRRTVAPLRATCGDATVLSGCDLAAVSNRRAAALPAAPRALARCVRRWLTAVPPFAQVLLA